MVQSRSKRDGWSLYQGPHWQERENFQKYASRGATAGAELRKHKRLIEGNSSGLGRGRLLLLVRGEVSQTPGCVTVWTEMNGNKREPGLAVKRRPLTARRSVQSWPCWIESLEQYWRNGLHRHLSLLLWNAEDWRSNGAPSAGPGTWFMDILLNAVGCRFPLISTHRTRSSLCATDTPEGCAYWWIHSLAQHTRDIPLKTTFFYWLVHLLLAK